MYLHGTSKINEQGYLEIGGVEAEEIAMQYGTPVLVYDEELIRMQCRKYKEAFSKSGFSYKVSYASKAFLCKQLVKLIEEEGFALDVVSGGELYTALQAGFPAERIHFHGNNKTVQEMQMGLEAHIGCFVVDNFWELELLHTLAEQRRQKVDILLRITPGIEASTHAYITTGQDDSKFGFSVKNGQAMQAARIAAKQPFYNLIGVHCHIGSQIFETVGFVKAVEVMTCFFKRVQEEGHRMHVLNLGGGFGIRYNEDDGPLPIKEYIEAMIKEVEKAFYKEKDLPAIWIEPGRSIVGEAGTTLYTIGAIKEIPGVRKYISVDGGISDNIRPALYKARHEAMIANRNDEQKELVSVAGKCCESGDMLVWDILLPKVRSGDILAVSCTGAYTYAMSNNYNKMPRPAVVFISGGKVRQVIRRETYEDLLRNEL
ncbi:diaminopimelate decarboxylase [Ectobacillus sp. JY-23]|uniref:diaminopimelate decarboxylase n=1 Tax=Ectobacillus sp. JY-23 TaxID=2933872 RepID=UPI001FF66E18|nr:diaminopimelate decarboxylase [Ectobacillus sp. JY-23]UOY94501.1 diaminopimelate decarboxylase [Ectobacillus sp. JY-23]